MDFIEKYQEIFESTKKLKNRYGELSRIDSTWRGSCYSDGVRTLKTPQHHRWGGVLLDWESYARKESILLSKKRI